MAFKTFFVGIFLSFLQCYLILAQEKPCGDHDVKVNYFRNCPEPKNQNIKIQNMTIVLTDDCKLVPRGCFKIKKPISKAKVEYYVSKPPFKKKGTEDFCKMLESPDTQKNIENYKPFPRKCTVAAGDYCVTKGSTKVEQLNPKTLNLLSGTTTGNFIVESEDSDDIIEKAVETTHYTVTCSEAMSAASTLIRWCEEHELHMNNVFILKEKAMTHLMKETDDHNILFYA